MTSIIIYYFISFIQSLGLSNGEDIVHGNLLLLK